jgi:hypothetical protein
MACAQRVIMLLNKLQNLLNMLQPRLTNCIECASIPALLTDIDCKLTDLAKQEYNNIIFSMTNYIPGPVIGDLLNYKRILTYKYCNPDYAIRFSVSQIASRVKVLIHK